MEKSDGKKEEAKWQSSIIRPQQYATKQPDVF